MRTEHTQLIRGLGLIGAASVNVANIIGTGVFLKARVMTCNVGTPGKALESQDLNSHQGLDSRRDLAPRSLTQV